jgi:hypothetical protein
MVGSAKYGAYAGLNPLANKIEDEGFPKTSVFGKATLDLEEKADFWPLFPKPFPKLTGFWNKGACNPKGALIYSIENSPTQLEANCVGGI